MEYQKYRKNQINHKGKHDEIEVQNRYLEAVKLLYVYLKKEGYVIHNPAQDIDYARIPVKLPKSALTHKEMSNFFKQVNTSTLLGYRDRTIFEVFYSSGIRRNELRNLELKDTDYEGGYLRVIGKGDKERVVPLGKVACKYVENYIRGIRPILLKDKESKYLFISAHAKQFTSSGLDVLVEKYAKRSSIKKKITTHTFRRSCATGMIRNNANVMHVKGLLGHSSMKSINRYIDLTIPDLKKAHQKTHPREKR
jgi:integrase/recombinase XerD